MVGTGILDYHEETGKGGIHRVYKPKMDESELKKFIAKSALKLNERLSRRDRSVPRARPCSLVNDVILHICDFSAFKLP